MGHTRATTTRAAVVGRGRSEVEEEAARRGGGVIVEAAARLPGGDVMHSVADVAVTHGHS